MISYTLDQLLPGYRFTSTMVGSKLYMGKSVPMWVDKLGEKNFVVVIQRQKS